MINHHAPIFYHICLAIVTTVVCLVVGLQALLLGFQEYRLRHKKNLHRFVFLPSLQSLERSLFCLIWVGFVLLSILLLSSMALMQPSWSLAALQKAVSACIAWGVFLVLLLGRYRSGWRGQTVVHWSIVGVSALVLGYFLSSIIL
ncbi:MAG: hypothetical protein DHS20C10_07100 [marine bacterium B5-7]|nr:MAG: hypothetical protein DHS20C10_07100 [marine bacterium B5-7]